VQAERAAFAPEADALAALSKLLNDGKFPAFLVARRQTQLLVNAGLILRRMTDDRYALHENFDILDVRLGQVRPANTLSGGETFLASLALALALGEISAAGGGTVDALFLDEGFGTLDDEALVAAVGELQQRSQGGRLIGLVSHVKAVADFVDDVLRVTPGLRGSVIRRMDDAARTLDAHAMLEGLAEPIAVEAAQ
jgi:exonuclease SbcC